MGETVYDKLGGAQAIDAAVDRFYEKVQADERLKPFFEGVDMQRLAGMQKGFLVFVFGGPAGYSGQTLKGAHARLSAMGHGDAHYDAVIEHLAATLSELGISAELIAEAAAIAESVRADVLGRT